MKKLLPLAFVVFSIGLFVLPFAPLASTAKAESATPSLDDLLAQRAELDKAIALANEDEIVKKAIEALTDYWATEIYGKQNEDSEDGYLEIKWTRVVYIKNDISGKGTDDLANMNCYVEFFLLSDHLSAPFYIHRGVYEYVAFLKDGSFEVKRYDPYSVYGGATFRTDFYTVVESVSDRGSDFNQVFKLLE